MKKRLLCRLTVSHFAALVFAFSLATVTTISSAYGASFDCSAARTSVEKVICQNEKISRLDDKMSFVYKDAKERNPQAIPSQRDWLKYVRNRCADTDCLADAYGIRIQQLRNGNLLGWMQDSTFTWAATTPVTTQKITYFQAGAEHVVLGKWLAESKILEESLALAKSAFNYPPSLKLNARHCQESNAYYIASSDTVVLCYQLVADLVKQSYLAKASRPNLTDAAQLASLKDSILFVTLHELGHAALHRANASPSLGREETEADSFASVVLIASKRTKDDLYNALWGVNGFFNSNVSAIFSDLLYSDAHELPQQRYINFSCLVAGKESSFSDSLVTRNTLTVGRAHNCGVEWKRRSAAVQQLVMRK